MGVELETCDEALMSAADATVTPTATNAKMVSLKAMPINAGSAAGNKERLNAVTVASVCKSFATKSERESASGHAVQSHSCVRSSEQRGAAP